MHASHRARVAAGPTPPARLAWDLGPAEWVVARISGVGPGRLRHCATVALGIDGRATIVGHRPGSGVIDLRMTGRDVDLAETAASALWAVPRLFAPRTTPLARLLAALPLPRRGPAGRLACDPVTVNGVVRVEIESFRPTVELACWTAEEAPWL